MAQKYEIHVEAERFIHNDLSSCAFYMRKLMHEKIDSGDNNGLYFPMMSCLVFSAFALEAKVNFVGWKVLKDGWPERANIKAKIRLLAEVLSLELDWGQRPLQTISKIIRFRDTLAHGKPEIVNETLVTDVEPEIWSALEAQWTTALTAENIDRCDDDVEAFWKQLLTAAGIAVSETLTHGGHHLSSVVE